MHDKTHLCCDWMRSDAAQTHFRVHCSDFNFLPRFDKTLAQYNRYFLTSDIRADGLQRSEGGRMTITWKRLEMIIEQSLLTTVYSVIRFRSLATHLLLKCKSHTISRTFFLRKMYKQKHRPDESTKY